MAVVAISLPVVFLVVLGVVLARSGFLTRPFVDGVNSFVYRVSLPALIVSSLTSQPLRIAAALPSVAALSIATVVILPFGYAVARALKLAPSATATLLQGSFRGNLAFIGLPVLTNVAGERGAEFVATSVLVFAPMMLLYNVLSVTLFHVSVEQEAPGRYWRAVKAIRSNPLILAALAGGLLAWLVPSMPAFVSRTLNMLGAPAAPLALICIGAAIAGAAIREQLTAGVVTALLKVAALPLLAWAVALSLRLNAGALGILMVFAACPTAAASFIVAKELGGDETLASNAIVLSTILSLVSMTLVLVLFF